ncbi:hypothetical protein HYT45_02415 [Candidatus Uhrbacteria bacterium]|nr:hypothetical protein [Candidatus Uhrbacteria bacterium]
MLRTIQNLWRNSVVRSAQFIDGEKCFSKEYGNVIRIDPELNCGNAWDKSREEALFVVEHIVWENGSCLVYARRLNKGGLYHSDGEIILLRQWDNDSPFAPVLVLGEMNPERTAIAYGKI